MIAYTAKQVRKMNLVVDFVNVSSPMSPCVVVNMATNSDQIGHDL